MRLLPWMHQPKPSLMPQDTEANKQGFDSYTAYSQLLDRNGQWIGVADTKAGIILAFVMALFPFLVGPTLPVIQKFLKAMPGHTSFLAALPTVGFLTLFGIVVITVVTTICLVTRTLLPKLERERKPALIFFGDIANQEYTQWLQQVSALDREALTQQVLEQIYTTACIAHRKHIHVRQAILGLLVSLFSGMLLYILSQFLG